jgi:tetratricopeptide (TPR) repeat protein
MMLKILFLFSLLKGFATEESLEALYQKKMFRTIVQRYGTKLIELERADQFLLAQAYMNLGNSKMSLRVFEIMIEKNPKDSPAYRKIAEIHRKEKKYREAIQSLKKAIELTPKYEQAYYELAQTILEFKPKNRMEVRMVYEDMVTQFGNKIEYQKHICDLAVKEGQHLVAEKSCKIALQLSPHEPLAVIGMGQILKDKLEYEKADAYFTKTMNEKGDDPLIAQACGDYFRERKQLTKALEAYEKAIASEGVTHPLLLSGATVACEVQQLEKCFQFYEKACSLSVKTRVDLRRSMTFVSVSQDPLWIEKFENLIASCK